RGGGGWWPAGGAGEPDRPVPAVVARAKANDRGAENVTGVEERRGHPRRDLELDAVLDALALSERGRRVRRRVERLARVGEGLGWRGARRELRILVGRGRELGRRGLVLHRRTIRVLLREALMLRRELLLELRRVEQDEPGEVDRPARRVDRPAETQLRHVRDQAAVIEVRVGEQ